LQQAGSGNLAAAIAGQGGIETIVWRNEPLGGISWKLELSSHFQCEAVASTSSPPIENLDYELWLSASNAVGFEIAREILCSHPDSEKADGFTFLDRNYGQAILIGSERERLEVPRDEFGPTQTILGRSHEVAAPREVCFLYERLANWGLYQNLDVHWDSPVRRPATNRNEIRLEGEGHNLVPLLHTLHSSDAEFQSGVNNAIQAAFGNNFERLEFTKLEDGQLRAQLRWKSLSHLQDVADLSDGTLRFLMLLAILLNPRRGDLVAIDEPEVSLDPSMLPIIAELAFEASRTSQVIVSTHSPEFLAALIEQGAVTTVVQAPEGETKLSTLDRDALARWLQKYESGGLFPTVVGGDIGLVPDSTGFRS
jgi:predicted ATPase